MRKNNVFWAAVFTFVGGMLLTGCRGDGGNANEPGQINLLSPEVQYGVGGTGDVKHVSVEVMSVPVANSKGGAGRRRPVAGERLLVRAVDSTPGLTPSIDEGITDAGGRLEFGVRLEGGFGDRYLDVWCARRPDIKRRLRFVTGVEIANDQQEVAAGGVLPDPLKISLYDANQEPIAGAPVYFSVASQPGSRASVHPPLGTTDSYGVAEVELRTEAGLTGRYRVNAEVFDKERGVTARPISLEANAIHLSGLIIGVLGGLAIFIYGMTLLSDGLQQVAGNRMKKVLAYITGNHVRAILAGASVAGLIQSSGATTVMTVGFVNAGLLTLKQAIGVVFGSNIGTTITGQMVSLNLSGIGLPATAVGVLLMLTLKRPAGQGLARGVLGFGLLMFGMNMMSSQLRMVSGFPSFVRFFQAIDCRPADIGMAMSLPLIIQAIGIGTVSTILVQSSAATIGLTIALANSGLINFWTAVPIILGDNIGTTFTAVVVSLGASRTARQTAVAHTLFNLFGTIVMVALLYVNIDGVPCFLYLVDLMTSGDAFTGENLGRHIAASHSMFNVLAVTAFTPLIGALAWVCTKIVPERVRVEEPLLPGLERGWLSSPSLALDGVLRSTAEMVERACGQVERALNAYHKGELPDIGQFETEEEKIDEMQRLIMEYLMKLTHRKLSAGQNAAVPVLVHCVADAERVADIALALARMCHLAGDEPLTEQAYNELGQVIDLTKQMGGYVVAGLRGEDVQRVVAGSVKLEKEIYQMCVKCEQEHVARLRRGECTIERGILYVEVLAEIESVVRHLGNIATRIEIAIGG